MIYKVEEPKVRLIATADYVARFRRVEYFEKLCRQCSNYAFRWGCPPFTDDPQPDLLQWPVAEIWLLKMNIYEVGSADDISQLYEILHRERGHWERRLLDVERERDGRAALFTGMCSHCGNTLCARRSGQPCRHPELVRPSLEALGFDLGKTADELFNLPLQWAKDGKMPDYLTLIGGVFY